MGLDTTHDCWHGPYSSFHRWRVAVAKSIGIDLDAMEGFKDGGAPWTPFDSDPIVKLLLHSDCDGSIAVADCGPLADRLTELLPAIDRIDGTVHGGKGWTPGWAARRFIDGLRLAVARGEDVEFH